MCSTMINSSHFRKWFRKKNEDSQNDKKIIQDDEEEQIAMKNDAMIGKMAAFFAHEIRNPLTSIIGFSQHLERNPIVKNDPNLSVYVSIIKEEALRMEVLIQELLNLSKLNYENDNVSIIDVKQSIEKIITIYSPRAKEKNIQFKTELIDNVFINGNSERFERVLINLVINAIEAIEEKGIIEIAMKKENHCVVIMITDNGPGIEEENLEQIFYPFYTTKDDGTGIGLPICRSIIEALGGNITIKNAQSGGVQAILKIPLSKQTV